MLRDIGAACGLIVLKAGVTRPPAEIEKEIVALVRSTAFRDTILAAFGGNGTAPWNLPDGGVAHETARVLNGGTPRTLRVVQGNKPLLMRPGSEPT